jgi:hypothetical protein
MMCPLDYVSPCDPSITEAGADVKFGLVRSGLQRPEAGHSWRISMSGTWSKAWVSLGGSLGTRRNPSFFRVAAVETRCIYNIQSRVGTHPSEILREKAHCPRNSDSVLSFDYIGILQKVENIGKIWRGSKKNTENFANKDSREFLYNENPSLIYSFVMKDRMFSNIQLRQTFFHMWLASDHSYTIFFPIILCFQQWLNRMDLPCEASHAFISGYPVTDYLFPLVWWWTYVYLWSRTRDMLTAKEYWPNHLGGNFFIKQAYRNLVLDSETKHSFKRVTTATLKSSRVSWQQRWSPHWYQRQQRWSPRRYHDSNDVVLVDINNSNIGVLTGIMTATMKSPLISMTAMLKSSQVSRQQWWSPCWYQRQ